MLLISWIVTGNSGLISFRSDLWQVGFLGRLLWIMGWFLALIAVGCESEIYFYRVLDNSHLYIQSVNIIQMTLSPRFLEYKIDTNVPFSRE